MPFTILQLESAFRDSVHDNNLARDFKAAMRETITKRFSRVFDPRGLHVKCAVASVRYFDSLPEEKVAKSELDETWKAIGEDLDLFFSEGSLAKYPAKASLEACRQALEVLREVPRESRPSPAEFWTTDKWHKEEGTSAALAAASPVFEMYACMPTGTSEPERVFSYSGRTLTSGRLSTTVAHC